MRVRLPTDRVRPHPGCLHWPGYGRAERDARAPHLPGRPATGSDPSSPRSVTRDEVRDHGDHRSDQEQVDGEGRDVEGHEAQQPQDGENSSNDQQDHDDLLRRMRRGSACPASTPRGKQTCIHADVFRPVRRSRVTRRRDPLLRSGDCPYQLSRARIVDASTAGVARGGGEVHVTLGDELGWTVTLDQDRSASLLVRVWLDGDTDEFRARLTSADTSPGQEGAEVTVGVASSPDDVITAVRTWLATLLGPAATLGPDPS